MPESRGPRIFLADLLVEHFEELVFLAGERRDALRSKLYSRSSFEFLSERQAAHVDGLLVGGERSISFLKAALGEQSPDLLFAAGRVLLATHEPANVDLVLAALNKAEAEPPRDGLVRALCGGPIDLYIVEQLQKWYATSPPAMAASAAEVLAYHRILDPRSARLTDLLNDADPAVRKAAWQAAALAG